MPPLRLLMDRTNDEQPDFGTTLDGQLRPGIGLTVVAPVDTEVYTPAGPPVEVLELSTLRTDTGGAQHVRRAARRRRGRPTRPRSGSRSCRRAAPPG